MKGRFPGVIPIMTCGGRFKGLSVAYWSLRIDWESLLIRLLVVGLATGALYFGLKR